MQFRISDTFTDHLSRLTADEQKAVKITAFDLQQNPANPGMQLHRMEKSKDKHFWSAGVGSDLRLIVQNNRATAALDAATLPYRMMDESDLQEVYNTERHLLYVACTRARDRLLVSSVSPASELMDDLTIKTTCST